MHIYNLRWLAKLTFDPSLGFEFRELRQYGKFLTELPGLACAWVHPRHQEKYSLLVKFDGKRVPSKKFFSPAGFHSWDYLNAQYQGKETFSRAILNVNVLMKAPSFSSIEALCHECHLFRQNASNSEGFILYATIEMYM